MFDDAGPLCTVPKADNPYILALLNSKVGELYMSIISPTMNILPGHINSIPIRYDSIVKDSNIKLLSQNNISIAKKDWDSFETSWDFKSHPLLGGDTIQNAFENWSEECNTRYFQCKENEAELNRIFIEMYGFQREMGSKVDDRDVSIRKASLQRDVKSYLAFAVGCMFGRYSLDVDGLVYAGGNWDQRKYNTFIPDIDNCIPITDENYFGDDIVGRFVDFIRCSYGSEKLEENLDFVAKALDANGSSSREVIRNYFVKDFFKDHMKTYQKRPIYWIYDSGKENGFKALVYMHRYLPDTTGMVRVEYLHKIQKIYEGEIERLKELAEKASDSRQKSQAEKRIDKLIKQLKETQEYDKKIAHLALARIEIDLDDGVITNYQKVQTSANGIKYDILAKI